MALVTATVFEVPPDLAPDAIRVCSGKTLTARGLRNSGGEVIQLRAPDGKVLSSYGGYLDMSRREGCAAIRVDLEGADEEGNWVIPEGDACRSPGWIDDD